MDNGDEGANKKSRNHKRIINHKKTIKLEKSIEDRIKKLNKRSERCDRIIEPMKKLLIVVFIMSIIIYFFIN